MFSFDFLHFRYFVINSNSLPLILCFVPFQLDKTYTGLQTLGAETLVDIWLHEVQREGSDEQGNYYLDAIFIRFL